MSRDLKYESGEVFFNILQENVDFTIPKDIRKILLFNYYDSAIALSKLDSESVKEIEIAMRSDFKPEMLGAGETMGDYLCRYSQNQIHFKLFGGQIKLINAIVDYCRNLYKTSKQKSSSESLTSESPTSEQNPTLRRQGLVDVSSECLQKMMKGLHKWMIKQNIFSKSFLEKEIIFRVNKETLKQNADGSMSMRMKCPAMGCNHECTITLKAYPTYYKRKKISNKAQNLAAPTWNLSYMKKHLKRFHSSASSSDSVDESDTGEESDEVEASGTEDSNEKDESAKASGTEDSNESAKESGTGDCNENNESSKASRTSESIEETGIDKGNRNEIDDNPAVDEHINPISVKKTRKRVVKKQLFEKNLPKRLKK